jgi:ribosomal protein L23
MDFAKVILKPLQTEKRHVLQAMETKKYSFIVDVRATKKDILVAFQMIYNVSPISITTQIRKPAKIRTGTSKPGFSKLTKIAIVTLAKNVDIINADEQTKNKAKVEEKIANSDVVRKEIK